MNRPFGLVPRSLGARAPLAAVAAVAALAVPSLAPSSGGARQAAASPRHGSFAGEIDIGGGRKLYLRCAGGGGPTVILESGIHDSSDVWTLSDAKPPVVGSPAVFGGVARFTHVCGYDRPGTIRYTNPPALTSRSSRAPMPRTLQSMVADLHALLHKADVPGPYLLVAHSYGGLIVRYYAQKYPREAAGMVLVDAFGTNIKGLFGRLWPRYKHLLNFPGTPLENDPRWETVDADGAIRAINNAKLPPMPLAVISKTEPFATAPGTPKELTRKLEQVWPDVQSALVNLEPLTPHILATDSDHYIEINDPDLTISVIKLILDRARNARTGRPADVASAAGCCRLQRSE